MSYELFKSSFKEMGLTLMRGVVEQLLWFELVFFFSLEFTFVVKSEFGWSWTWSWCNFALEFG